MRQAGVIAAAGIVALNTGIERLAEDHDRARRLAALLAEVPGVSVSPVVTNFVMINVAASGRNAKEVVDELESHGIRSSARPPSTIRFVTQRQITDADLDTLAEVLRKVLA
jgi:threonine aldolase